jgi:hypothetical protein
MKSSGDIEMCIVPSREIIDLHDCRIRITRAGKGSGCAACPTPSATAIPRPWQKSQEASSPETA